MIKMMENKAWNGFKTGKWNNEVDVRDFIITNYTPYEGDDSFLAGVEERTAKLWEKTMDLIEQEKKAGGVLEVGTDTIQSITAYDAGYIDQASELIVGLQTDKPLKRAILPRGGWRVVETAAQEYGLEIDPKIKEIYTKYAKTHNQGVFDAYTTEMRKCRSSHIITGLPDAYGRGRIIGDYRRVALYGVDNLIEQKNKELISLECDTIDARTIKLREEISEQIRALGELKEMASKYGYDISEPASSAREAIQWTYFAYLAAVKEQDGAAMSLGRVSTFFDIYIQRDIEAGKLTESEAQELIDQLVIKLRIVRFLRTKDYNALFSGDPTWVTECVGGMAVDGRTLVTKSSFRIMQSLYNLGPAPEPNMTVLYSQHLPAPFKAFCAKASIDTGSIQYENDDLMRPDYGDDYAIACCVSAMKLGKQMQFFGARANLGKALLYALNQGRDEVSGEQVGLKIPAITTEYLEYDDVMEKFYEMLDWFSRVYINSLNVIHYMHDKYCYERLQMALHDRDTHRFMATGIAGLSVVADSLSAIKHAKVKPIRNEEGLIVDFEVEGDYPKFGNNDPRVDDIAVEIQKTFMEKIRSHKTYRRSETTLSVLTITSNVVYGKHTGNTPDGRKKGEPFAPGANPMHKREEHGALASLKSVSKLDYDYGRDGISYTFSIVPGALGPDEESRINNLVSILDGYFIDGGHHININVLDRSVLEDAMKHPEKYPQLTIRVSGYAVNFVKLTPEQQQEVISRTFYEAMASSNAPCEIECQTVDA